MAVEIPERVAGTEIRVDVHSRNLIPGNERAWWAGVRSGGRWSRKGGRRPRQREYALRRRRLAGSRALLHSVRRIAACPAASLLSAQRQSQKRGHRECCTPIAHLFPPELYRSNPVWFTRPPAGR